MELEFTPEKWPHLMQFIATAARLNEKGLIHDATRNSKQEFRNVAKESAKDTPTRNPKQEFRNVARDTTARNLKQELRNVATGVPAIEYAGKYVEKGNETLCTKNENNGDPISNGERTVTHPNNGFSKVEMTKRYGDRDNQCGGNRSRRLNIHRDDKNQNDEEGQQHSFSG